MVWTAEQTGAFLDHITDDPLYPMYHLIALRGLRRGEACGLHRADLDLDALTLTVRQQLVVEAWNLNLTAPKTDGSEATIALDTTTAALLREHLQRQDQLREAAGACWVENGLVFTQADGSMIHPDHISRRFKEAIAEAGAAAHPAARPPPRRRHPRPRRRRRHQDRPSHAAALDDRVDREHVHVGAAAGRPRRRGSRRRPRAEAPMTAVLGRLIAQRRRDLGMSQRELAERLCAETGRPTVTRHELSRYERGIRTSQPDDTRSARRCPRPADHQPHAAASRRHGDAAFHPTWCARDATCTAYDQHDSSQAHRTQPVVIDTEDDGVKICVWVDATPDGSRLSIEVSEVLGPTCRPFASTAASATNGSSFLADLEVAGDIAEAITLLLKRVSGGPSSSPSRRAAQASVHERLATPTPANIGT